MRIVVLVWLLLWGEGLAAEVTSRELTEAARTAGSVAEQELLEIVAEQLRLREELEEADEVGRSQVLGEMRMISRAYQSYIARNREDVIAHILFGKFLYELGRNADALPIFLRADELDPSHAVVKQHLGNLLAEDEKYPEALNFFLQAVDLAPSEALYHFSIGHLLATHREAFLADGVYTAAIVDRQLQEALRRATELAPDDLDLWMRYGESFYDVAEPDWERALRHWEGIPPPGTSPVLREAIVLHQARVLTELTRFSESEKLLATVTRPSFAASKAQVEERMAELQAE